jgi:hypothetical protein
MVEMVQPSERPHFNGVRLKVGLRMLMAMRDGGVAFQAEKKLEVGTEKTGRWGSKRAKSMSERWGSGRLNRGRVTACA